MRKVCVTKIRGRAEKMPHISWVYTRTRPPRSRLRFSLAHRRDTFRRHPQSHPHARVTCLTSYRQSFIFWEKERKEEMGNRKTREE